MSPNCGHRFRWLGSSPIWFPHPRSQPKTLVFQTKVSFLEKKFSFNLVLVSKYWVWKKQDKIPLNNRLRQLSMKCFEPAKLICQIIYICLSLSSLKHVLLSSQLKEVWNFCDIHIFHGSKKCLRNNSVKLVVSFEYF